jgi:hypothetical protein
MLKHARCVGAYALLQAPLWAQTPSAAGAMRDTAALTISAVCLAAVAALYFYLRLRPGARARTPQEFFLFDKQVTGSQYFDTTVAYSLQVVVTVFFVYWGFVYGVGMFYYSITWFIGILLFQLSAPRLAKFAVSYYTLHGFLAQEYGASRAIQRITAACTLLGLTGGLLIEVSLTTDILTSVTGSSDNNVPWVVCYCGLLLLGWLYLTWGGYKSAVLTYGIQLPIIYATLCMVMCYLMWLAFRAGYFRHAVWIGALIFALWAVIFAARTKSSLRRGRFDNAGMVALYNAALILISLMVFAGIYWNRPVTREAVTDSPDSFNLAAFTAQNWIVAAGFTLLNLTTQFCDMSAWQRISSLHLEKSISAQIRQLKNAIGETKWESPVTWGFGIALGIALRHSGLFNSTAQGFNALSVFTGSLAHSNRRAADAIGAYVILPCLVVAFTSIMFSTVDGFLATVIFTWNEDIAGHGVAKDESRDGNTRFFRRARSTSLTILVIAGALFVVLHRFLKINIFLLLNAVASTQFTITFLSVGALFLPCPREWRRIVIVTAAAALIANVLTATYCYSKMLRQEGQVWEDWFFVLPTLGSAAMGIIVFGAAALWKNSGQVARLFK